MLCRVRLLGYLSLAMLDIERLLRGNLKIVASLPLRLESTVEHLAGFDDGLVCLRLRAQWDSKCVACWLAIAQRDRKEPFVQETSLSLQPPL